MSDAPPRRLLVVKLADIGDVLTATPALRALRHTYPAAHLTALVTPNGAQALRGSPLVDELLLLPKDRFDSPRAALHPASAAYALGFGTGLRRHAFDWVLLLHHLTTRWGTAKHAALCLATGAPRLAGLDNGRGWFLTDRVHDRGFGACHEVEYALQVAALASATTDDTRLDLPLTGEDERAAEALLGDWASSRPIAIHPGTGAFGPGRRWYPESFAAVARELARRIDAPIVLVGGPDEEGLARSIGERAGRPMLNLAGRTTVGQLGAVLRRCRLFIGSDSGVMHVAAAVGTPLVAVFGPSNERAWGPWTGGQGHAAVVRHDLPCSPCFYTGHRLGRRRGCPERTCLQLVSPAEVCAAAEGVLAAAGAGFEMTHR